MKNTKPLKKFFHNKGATIILGILVAVLVLVYCYFIFEISNMNIEISNNNIAESKKNEIVIKYNRLQTFSEITLVVFSVAASSLVSSLLIEKRSSNKIVEDIFIDEFFTSDEFLGILSAEKQKQILISLEKQLKFDDCREKSEMYYAVKEKINKPLLDYELFYDKYYLHVNCDIKDTYIEKHFLKCVEIKSLPKSERATNYNLLKINTPELVGIESAEITKLKINDNEVSLKDINKSIKKSEKQLDKNRGYSERIDFTYNNVLDFSNKKAVKIELEYITRCPINDKVYTCRLPYPCKNFDFNFTLNSSEYNLNTSAFGFIDDANKSPNHSDDKKNVSIKFEDWIFPLDGVCVYLEKSVAK